MSTLGEFPALCAAVKEIHADSGIKYVCEESALEVPETWEQNFQEAEVAARRIRGVSVRDFLTPLGFEVDRLCKKAGASADEDALLIMATGEASVREAVINGLSLTNSTHSVSLDEVLDSAFDGQVAGYWRKRHAR